MTTGNEGGNTDELLFSPIFLAPNLPHGLAARYLVRRRTSQLAQSFAPLLTSAHPQRTRPYAFCWAREHPVFAAILSEILVNSLRGHCLDLRVSTVLESFLFPFHMERPSPRLCLGSFRVLNDPFLQREPSNSQVSPLRSRASARDSPSRPPTISSKSSA